jgi:hypothetical protein
MVRAIRKNIAVFVGFQTSPACPSDKSSVKFKMSMHHWLTDTDLETRSTWRKTCPNVILSTINVTQPGPRSIPGLRGDTPATNCLHSTAFLIEISLHKF